ncbi:MAG TPA: NAD(P)/FAD-dependent oxidoreductase [Tepidisphaeraceae bacterium]|jgi:monoamine oxidase|nr:NAD(P)/FAD-dependent oxidoreductase [Tepidisphaeraceae bacterium]
MPRPTVIILGAGAAGMAAAAVLSEKGVPTLILESRDRIGGRIHTIRDSAFPIPIDLGAEYVHGDPEATWKIIREAKLIAHDVPFDNFELRGDRLVHLKNFSEKIGKIMTGVPRADLSFAEFLQKYKCRPNLANARRLAIHFVQGFDAADPQLASTQSIAEEWKGIGDIEEETQHRILEGHRSIIEHLHRSLDRKRVQIRLNTPVSEISWDRSKIICNSGKKTFQAKKLIVTLPLGLLQLPPDNSGAIRFGPDIPRKRIAANRLGSGPVVKALFKFREPFWENPAVARALHVKEGLDKAVFLHAPDLPFPTWWTALPLRLPVLTAWAGGPKARALAGLPRTLLIDAALDSLGKLLHQPRTRLVSLLEKSHVYDWLSDPFSRGAYSYITVGSKRARNVLAKPIEKTLFFAGEATDTSGQASTVAGALASGERAAREVLASL